eukprot:XP_019926948.1 PREDICTED: laccase-3-like [Crassostrea gigas]
MSALIVNVKCSEKEAPKNFQKRGKSGEGGVYADNFNCTGSCYVMTHTTDGTNMGVDPVHSGLINGKGHYYPDDTEKPLDPELPLETFKVKPEKHYRFRIINVAMFVSFRFSIDEQDAT